MTLCLFPQVLRPGRGLDGSLKSIVPIVQHANLSQTGSDLISAKTGIIMCQTAEPIERVVAAPSAVLDTNGPLVPGGQAALADAGYRPDRVERREVLRRLFILPASAH